MHLNSHLHGFFTTTSTALQHDILRLIKFNFEKATIFIPVSHSFVVITSAGKQSEIYQNHGKSIEERRKNGFISSKKIRRKEWEFKE